MRRTACNGDGELRDDKGRLEATGILADTSDQQLQTYEVRRRQA